MTPTDRSGSAPNPRRSARADRAEGRFRVICVSCERRILVREAWTGKHVSCPHCESTLRVPQRPASDALIRAQAPFAGARRYFNFVCPECGSLLEGHTQLAHRQAPCPTCHALLRVPELDENGTVSSARVIKRAEEDAHAHTFASQGVQAPQIQKRADGELELLCPACNTTNRINADACARCGTPFTIEGAEFVVPAQRMWRGQLSTAVGVIALLAALSGFNAGAPVAIVLSASGLIFGLFTWELRLAVSSQPLNASGIVLNGLALLAATGIAWLRALT